MVGGFFLTQVLTKWPKNQKGLQTEICNPLIILVRLAGIEPTTPWFVARFRKRITFKINDLAMPIAGALHQSAGECTG